VTVSELYRIERPWTLPGREEYLQANTDYYTFFMECSTSVSPSDTTLLVNIDRPFYFPGHTMTGRSRVPRELLELFWAGASAEEVVDTLRSMGVSMLAMDMVYTTLNVMPELKGDELGYWREFTAGYLEPMVTSGRYVLFRLREGS